MFYPYYLVLIQKKIFTMNDNFSPRVKRIFTYSKEEAVRLGQSTVGTEHFILAILQENEGSAINLLHNLNIDMERLRQNIHTLTSARVSILLILTLFTLPCKPKEQCKLHI